MIFFREHRAFIRFHKNPGEIPQGFFLRIRADFRGPIDPESGMILNLVDVDSALKQVILQNSESLNSQDFLKKVAKSLHSQFPAHFFAVTAKWPHLHITYESEHWNYLYNTRTWFKSDASWSQRRVILESSRPLSRTWRQSFKVQRWAHFDECVRTLKNLKGPLIGVQIERPEWGGWERWSLKNRD